MSRVYIIVSSVILLLILISGLFWIKTKDYSTLSLQQPKPVITTSITTAITTLSPTSFPTLSSVTLAPWKTFTSKYGYSFQYPPDFNPSGRRALGYPPGSVTEIDLYKSSSDPKPTDYSYYGVFLTVDIAFADWQIQQEKPEAFPTLYPHKYTINNDLLPPSVILPPDTTTGGYWIDNSPSVDFFTHNLSGKFHNIPVALRFGCSDDTQKNQCKNLLPQVLSTLRFNMQ